MNWRLTFRLTLVAFTMMAALVGFGFRDAHAATDIHTYRTTNAHLSKTLHTLIPDLAVGWCSSENCDDHYQDGGSANCSTFQIIITTQTVRDFNGTAFGTAYTFESQNTNNGTPCYAAWGALQFSIGYAPDGPPNNMNTCFIGTLNTILFGNACETTIGSNIWQSTYMLSDVDESGTCVSAWYAGPLAGPNNYQANYNDKVIAGGSHC